MMPRTAHAAIMGILNVTPDSFSDGGRFLLDGAAIAHATEMLAHGADVIDIGAESTRPGSHPVEPEEEWRRLEPVLERLIAMAGGARLSVDTRHPETMEKAARLGVRMINNVAGLAPVSVLRTLGGIPGMRYVAMHMHGTPLSMQQHPLEPPEAEALVGAFFEKAHEALLSAGFSREHIYLDAGIGFGKTDAANVRLLGLTHKWAGKWQIAVGLSRKSWIGRALEIASPEERDTPSKMLELAQMQAGARLIRTHDTKTLARLRNLMYDIR